MSIGESILILGASSWLGHYLVPSLVAKTSDAKIIATYANTRPAFKSDSVKIIQCSSANFTCIENHPFSTLINLTRGETPKDFEFHQYLINLVNQRDGRYIYASSSNAVDRDVSKPHFETDRADAQSEYGKFKAQCEEALFKRCRNFLAFRFSATHGWAPNRIARTEEFLQKLHKGEKIVVRKGIVQNRTFVGTLANLISRLVLDQSAEGVFHLGATDFSEEVIFSKRLASAFGYDPSLVVEGETVNWNLVTVLGKLTDRYPNLSLPTEMEAIADVRAQSELANYVSLDV